MKKGWIMTLLLVLFALAAQQSVVFSQKSNKTKLLAQYNNDTYTCTAAESTEGWAKLGFANAEKQKNIEKCINDTNNSNKWCCVCFAAPKPGICSQLFAALTDTSVPTSTPVPINCAWSNWTDCHNEKNCGTGTRTRYPSPAASNGGTICDGDSWEYCNLTPCPIDCVISDWSTCSTPCGWGVQTKTILTAAAYNGKACPNPTELTKNCLLKYCPIDCVLSNWSTCTKPCGGGTQTNEVLIMPAYEGKSCGPRSQSCNTQSCSALGSGEVVNTTSNTSNAAIIFVTTNNVIPTPIRIKTPTPIPHSPTPTKIPATPTIKLVTDTISPTLIPSPTLVPTIIPIIPTAIPVPTAPFIPSSLTSQQTVTEKKTTYVLDGGALAGIKIVPNALASEKKTSEKPLLPQEQRLQTKSESVASGGILITLQQKIGSAFVTRQDELTVKRGNQFFTISNQESNLPLKNNQEANSNQSSSNSQPEAPPAPLLEINANNVIAQSSMGLSVDPLSGILTVDTPTGPQKVSIMPDEALGIVVALKALNSKGVVETSLLLVSENGALIYRISGAKVEKFLGLLPLAIQKQVLISADTGSIVKVELPLISRILSYFTF